MNHENSKPIQEGVREAVYYFNHDTNITASICGKDISIEITKALSSYREQPVWHIDMNSTEFKIFAERIIKLIDKII